MNFDMALLILCWQTACLSHELEHDKLLPGAKSATEAESAELDKIHDDVTPGASWTNSTTFMPVSSRRLNVPKLASKPSSRRPVMKRSW